MFEASTFFFISIASFLLMDSWFPWVCIERGEWGGERDSNIMVHKFSSPCLRRRPDVTGCPVCCSRRPLPAMIPLSLRPMMIALKLSALSRHQFRTPNTAQSIIVPGIWRSAQKERTWVPCGSDVEDHIAPLSDRGVERPLFWRLRAWPASPLTAPPCLSTSSPSL